MEEEPHKVPVCWWRRPSDMAGSRGRLGPWRLGELGRSFLGALGGSLILPTPGLDFWPPDREGLRRQARGALSRQPQDIGM